MNERFVRHIENLEPTFRQLIEMQPVKADALPRNIT